MSQTATLNQLVNTAAQLEVATHLLLVEWLVKLQQQLSRQQRLIEEQQQQLKAQRQEIEQLKEERDKLKNRSSQNSSVPPSSDLLKKSSDKSKRKKGKKRGPKYNHPGQTRNGFGEPDQIVLGELENCPVCGTSLERVEEAPLKVQQVAEVVEQPVEIREYRRPLYQCPNCGWSGYSPLPLGVKEGFSYGGRLCSIVGWLGYGGNLTWRKQEYFVEYVLGVSISQGSLAKMQKWFLESLLPSYQQWLSYIQQPGVRCVDETTYCIDGIKYWLWVATSDQVCALMLAPTRSSAELEKLLGSDFEGILSRDCFSAYNPQTANAKQKCLTHLQRHWDEWFTFLSYPEVKPDNNDAERALRPIVVHRKVSGGARSNWGAQLVAQMFSFLETMRLQGKGAIASLSELLSLAGRSPPGLEST